MNGATLAAFLLWYTTLCHGFALLLLAPWLQSRSRADQTRGWLW